MEALFVTLTFALGALVQTVAGFGSALVIMPLLTQVVGVKTAAPVQALLGLLVTIIVLRQNWHALRWREAARLITGSVVGIPLGAMALKSLPAAPVTLCLGVILLGYAMFEFLIAPRLHLPDGEASLGSDITIKARILTGLVGFCSGVLGGAYATDGPPLIVYGAVKRWPKATFKSILQSCFLVNGVLMVFCQGAAGLITQEVFHYALYAAPGLVLGVIAGTYLDRRVEHNLFRRLLLWLIVVLGLTLLLRGLV